jgi:oligopeptide transport system ATP-binding protein
MSQNSKENNPLVDILTKKAETQMDTHGVSFKKDLALSDTILSVRHLKMFFPMGHGKKLKAVHDVSFDIKKGECFGLVGESGCGKTTTGRSLIRLYDITSGAVYFKGYRINAGSRWNEKEIKWSKIKGENKIKELRQMERSELSEMENVTPEGKLKVEATKKRYEKQIKEIQDHITAVRKEEEKNIRQIRYDDSHVDPKLMSKMQMIFQDPIDSLDPRMTVEDIIQEGLRIQGHRNRAENHQKVCEVLEEVGLIADYASRYPNEFSGGQRQRIGIARAIVMNPEFLICDEPISALDVSIRAQIINLLNDLKENHGLTLMFIAHDLSVVKYFCDRIAVMYFGEMVEMAPSDELFRHPLHPYTRALLSAIPKPDPLSEKKRKRILYNPAKEHDYTKEKPKFQEILPGHFVLANSEEIEKYQEMIKKDDIANAKKAEEEKKNGTAY